MSLADIQAQGLGLDPQLLDHSLTTEEQFTQLQEYKQLLDPDNKPYSKEEQDYYERQQERAYKRYAQKNYNKNRNKESRPVKINDTYFYNSTNFNLLSLWDKDQSEPIRKRNFKKQPFKRFNLIIKKKSNSFDLNKALRESKPINQTYLTS